MINKKIKLTKISELEVIKEKLKKIIINYLILKIKIQVEIKTYEDETIRLRHLLQQSLKIN